MADRWMAPPEEENREATIAERSALLVDLLLLTDALPPRPHVDLEVPSFRVLCARR
jgi:hypothetical protein